MKEKVGGLKRDLVLKLNYIFIKGLVRVQNLRSIYMECVMQEVDFCLSLGWVYTHGLNEELGRHRGREGKTKCFCVG